MKALVTGGAGFIGSHLVDRLVAQGEHAIVVDNLSTGKSEHVHRHAEFHRLDIGSPSTRELIVRTRPNVVFHLAAQSDVQRSLREPAYDVDVNLTGTVRLLDACREAGVDKFVFASTCAVYGETGKEMIEEDDDADPISYYGMSKWAAEHYIRLFRRLHGLNYTILRLSNVYGPRQSPHGESGVVAQFCRRIANGQPLVVNGDGEQTRDFVYVGDVADAFVAAGRCGECVTLHASTSEAASVNDVVALLCRLCPSKPETIHGPERPGEIQHSRLSNKRAYELLGWKPRYSLAEGLQETAAYYFERS